MDWRPGDEAVIISGMSVEGTESMEEVVVVETVHNAELHLRSPLRYSNFSLDRFAADEDEVCTNWPLDMYLLMRYISVK